MGEPASACAQDHTLPALNPEMEAARLAFVIGHDLRASSRALKEIPAWVMEDIAADGMSLSDETKENLELIIHQAQRLDQMLVDLTAFLRVGTDAAPGPQDLGAVLAAEAPKIARPQHKTLEVQPAEDAVVWARSADLALLVRILIENAVEHGGAAIRVATHAASDHVTLSVWDCGPGVPDAALGKIFEPMTTLIRRDEARGSGMGLAIAHKIVSQMKGGIQVHNGPSGFAITATLPRATTSDAAQDTAPARPTGAP